MLTSKLEVLVDFGPKPDENVLNRTLDDLKSRDGVKNAIFKDGAIIVETTLPNQAILDLVAESSGKRTVLQGFGDTMSAVAMLTGPTGALGVIRFQQAVGPSKELLADGCVDGLTPGAHGLHVRAHGDLSQGCSGLGPHYDPAGGKHGSPHDPPGARHAGDLGNIVADEAGRATFRIQDAVLQIGEIIGRCIAITERADDLGRGSTPNSKVDGNSGEAIACGIIARSAGVLQNPKRVCQCDGVVVWDERDKPIAGKGRRDTCCQKKGDDSVGVKPCCKV